MSQEQYFMRYDFFCKTAYEFENVPFQITLDDYHEWMISEGHYVEK